MGHADKHDIQELKEIQQLMEDHEGFWGFHPEHSVKKWKDAVVNGGTRSGYWEWVHNEIYGI